jgi:alpha-ketoglutarate-dependent taurine dioxygenase
MFGDAMNKITEYSDVKFEEIKNNIKTYSESLLLNGVIVFKKLFASEDEQKQLAVLFGNHSGWVPNDSQAVVNGLRYQENHELSIKLKENSIEESDGILIPWHLENPYANDPEIGALWNNINFKCDSKFGKTGFVDMRKVYKFLPNSVWRDLVDKSEWRFPWLERVKPIVEKHRVTNEKILRYDATHFYLIENFVNGVEPSSVEIETFKKIFNWVIDQIKTNEDIQQWHEWDEGDMVVVDLQVSCHCVTDGFLSTEREFIGYWCFAKNVRDEEREKESLLLTKTLTSMVGMEDPNKDFY